MALVRNYKHVQTPPAFLHLSTKPNHYDVLKSKNVNKYKLKWEWIKIDWLKKNIEIRMKLLDFYSHRQRS